MRAIVCSLAALSVVFCLNVQAATSLDAATLQKLTQLERKYFEESFDADTDEARIERLEKLVFGEPASGAVQPRIEKLVAAVAAAHENNFDADNLGTQVKQTTTSGAALPSAGKTHQPTKTAAQQVLDPDDSSMSDDDADVDPSSSRQDNYPHVTALEREILGKSFVGQPLVERFSRMETKAFGVPSQSQDLSQRTDALEKYAEKTLHKKPFGSGLEQAETTQQSKLPLQLLSTAGNALLGMSGSSFSGVRVHQREEMPEEPESKRPVDDDPEVYENDPPPPDAKILVKVGWCEVKMFGRTFSQLHLIKRLEQLNTDLKVKPGESGMELMDDADLMVKSVQARKSALKK